MSTWGCVRLVCFSHWSVLSPVRVVYIITLTAWWSLVRWTAADGYIIHGRVEGGEGWWWRRGWCHTRQDKTNKQQETVDRWEREKTDLGMERGDKSQIQAAKQRFTRRGCHLLPDVPANGNLHHGPVMVMGFNGWWQLKFSCASFPKFTQSANSWQQNSMCHWTPHHLPVSSILCRRSVSSHWGLKLIWLSNLILALRHLIMILKRWIIQISPSWAELFCNLSEFYCTNLCWVLINMLNM